MPIMEKTSIYHQYRNELTLLADTIKRYNQQGLNPATSSNYSIGVQHEGNKRVLVSQSGKDKRGMSAEDFLMVDLSANVLDPINAVPSAETLLHTSLYAYDPTIGCVLHNHSMNSIVLSDMYRDKKKLVIKGLEILKAFPGIKSHDVEVEIPIFKNTQDMEKLSRKVINSLEKRQNTYAYLIAGHGYYTWGVDLQAANRHVETCEYIFDYMIRMR